MALACDFVLACACDRRAKLVRLETSARAERMRSANERARACDNAQPKRKGLQAQRTGCCCCSGCGCCCCCRRRPMTKAKAARESRIRSRACALGRMRARALASELASKRATGTRSSRIQSHRLHRASNSSGGGNHNYNSNHSNCNHRCER